MVRPISHNSVARVRPSALASLRFDRLWTLRRWGGMTAPKTAVTHDAQTVQLSRVLV